MYILSIELIGKIPMITLRNKNRNIYSYELTKKGCKLMGAYIAKRWGYEFFCIYSSSTDFPQDYKRNFRYDVRDLVAQGFKDALPPVRQRTVGNYEIRGNQYIAIAINVKKPEDSHYFDIDPEINNDAFIRACAWARH